MAQVGWEVWVSASFQTFALRMLLYCAGNYLWLFLGVIYGRWMKSVNINHANWFLAFSKCDHSQLWPVFEPPCRCYKIVGYMHSLSASGMYWKRWAATESPVHMAASRSEGSSDPGFVTSPRLWISTLSRSLPSSRKKQCPSVLYPTTSSTWKQSHSTVTRHRRERNWQNVRIAKAFNRWQYKYNHVFHLHG